MLIPYQITCLPKNQLKQEITMSKAGFKYWQNFVFKNEGGYGNDARDPGGETNHGITWIAYQDLGPKVYTSTSYNHWRNLTESEVERFARYYWLLFKGDAIKDDRLAIMVVYAHWASLAKGFDLIRKMQAWLNSHGKKVTVDGVIYSGNETVDAINSLSASKTTELAKFTLEYSTAQFKADPNYSYFQGWDKIISFLESVVNTAKNVATSPKTYLGIGIGIAATLIIINNLSTKEE